MGNWAWGMGNWALGMGHGALNLPIHSFPLPSSLSLVPSVTESAAELPSPIRYIRYRIRCRTSFVKYIDRE